MTRHSRLGALIAVLAISMTAAFATTASATPGKTSACSNCHEGAGATIATTLLTTLGTTATYNVSAPGADNIAIFNGSTFVATISGATGTFSVPTGGTYTLYAVTGPTETDGLGTSTVSPVAAPTDTTAPVTTSNAAATYVSSAAIMLTATDAGSGVATTYYKLDGGTQTAGTAIAVSTVGSHTIEFWSTDVAGNAETHTTASFTITAPTAVDVTAPITTSDAVASYVSSAAIKLIAADAGSGVATTYYKLDGGTQTAGTAIAVSIVGSHTIDFWSVDVAGNVETANSATFTITAPPVVSGTATTTISIHASHDVKHDKYESTHGKKHSGDKRHKGDKRRSSSIQLSGKLMPAADHASVSLYVMNPGSSTWTLVKILKTNGSHKSKAAMWSYRTDVNAKGSYEFQVRFAGDDAYKASVSKIATVKIR